jgi:alanyl-tRNA synthetase
MRRAMRHAHLLGAEEPLMHRLVPALVREMGEAYPELGRGQALITETLKLEETRFRKTLERGLGLLADESSGLSEGDTFSGETAFRLYDTYGFPLDLTQDALRARGIGVDTDAFATAMERQKAEARAAWKGSGEAATETVWFDIREKVGATEFLGYETERAEGVVTALVADGAEATALEKGQTGAIVLNQTPFYGESGGQVGDRGEIRGEGGAIFTVTDTQKHLGDVFVHVGEVTVGSFKAGQTCELIVDHDRRTAVRANHSATHLIHEALREVLGDHVAQKGSLVAPDRLRFDFSHPKPIDTQELERIEAIANTVVAQNAPVETRLMAYDDAIETGAMALFGEKYGDEVRVVSMGEPKTNGGQKNKPWSIELCGGTHVKRTGDIGTIHIVSESASAAGVRRIEALTADGARQYLAQQDERVKQLAALLRTRGEEVVGRVEQLLEERKQLDRQLADAKRQLAMGGGAGAGGGGGEIEEVSGVKFLARSVEGLNPKDLRGLVDAGKKQVESGIVAIVGKTEDGKAGLAVGVTDDLKDKWSAVDLVRAGSAALGGKGGGGRPDMAQAGGPDGDKAGEALAAIKAALAG